MTSPVPTNDPDFPAHLLPVAERICERFYRAFPDTDAQYGARGRSFCAHDNAYLAGWLLEGVERRNPESFRRNVHWLAGVLTARGFPLDRFIRNVRMVVEVLIEEALAPAEAAESVAAAALSGIEDTRAGPDDTIDRIGQARARYLAALLAAEPREANGLLDELLRQGVEVERIYEDVVERALVEVGEKWQAAQISVAEEHLAAAIAQVGLARLAPALLTDRPPLSRTAILACTPGELHTIGLRMVGDFLEADGWEVLYVGASTPASDLGGLVEARQPDIVALSTTLSSHLQGVSELLQVLHELTTVPPLIVLGGQAYGGDVALAREMGADVFASSASLIRAALRERFSTP